jgi:hypothetical protein
LLSATPKQFRDESDWCGESLAPTNQLRRQPRPLAALSFWLLVAVFWSMIVPLATEVIAPVDPFDLRS